MKQLVKVEEVRDRMLTLRNKHVLLDSDVAALYGVATKEVKHTVKRKPEQE